MQKEVSVRGWLLESASSSKFFLENGSVSYNVGGEVGDIETFGIIGQVNGKKYSAGLEMPGYEKKRELELLYYPGTRLISMNVEGEQFCNSKDAMEGTLWFALLLKTQDCAVLSVYDSECRENRPCEVIVDHELMLDNNCLEGVFAMILKTIRNNIQLGRA